MPSYKQAIMLRTDADMSKGKMIAQACHASLKTYKRANKTQKENWEQQGSKKIVLKTREQQIEKLYRKAKRNSLPTYLVKDAGKTEVPSGTKTALGIGPAKEQKINPITGDLSLIK